MGFFSSGELAKTAKIKVSVDQLTPVCEKCGLHRTCISPKMGVTGEGRKKILIISEAPSAKEDEYGVQFVGEAGEFLKDELKYLGISLTRDCWKLNAVHCRIPGDRPPAQKEIKACQPSVEKHIRQLKPKLIILAGSVAVTSLFGDDFSDRTMNRWRGLIIPDEKYKCHILPIFHPSYLIRNQKDKNLHCVYERDLKLIPKALKREYKEHVDYEQYVKNLTDFVSVKKLLERILYEKPELMFDYETTGLKPYREGHKIATIGVALSTKEAYSFPYKYRSFWTDREFAVIADLWKKILLDRKIKKMAHNHKFEDAWSRVRAGARPKGWYWDPMMAEHILDNRSYFTGLKFQAFIKYGIRPYDKHMEQFLKASKGEFNTIDKAPLKDLLTYNGLDCIFAYMLYEEEKQRFAGMKGLSRAYGFFMRGLYTMGTIQHGGINVDMSYYKKTKEDLTVKIGELEKYLTEGREAKKFKEKFGRPIKITSNPDLGKLFYEVLGKDPVKTDSGNYKTDKLTLESLNLPFVDKLLEMKRLEKAKGTYLGQFAREAYRGVMHPFFDLHIPVSYRSSSSMPNFQNLPKRDKATKKLIRAGIIPSPDCVLCEADFSGAEVITSASYHKDKQFIHDITVGDMHRDLATELFMLPPNMLAKAKKMGGQYWDWGKDIRFFTKNNWTFAQFYGDWFGSCGELLWENVIKADLKIPSGITAREWLERKGIYDLGEITKDGPTPGSFLEHCKNVEDRMWNERFADYTAWKQEIVEFYQRYGYIETFFGFRFTGYMDRKQCTNFPIQGTSFHLLVYTLIQVEKFIRVNKLRTKLIGQIHDSIIADVHKDELAFYLKGVHDIVAGLKDQFDWLIVPMGIEAEISKLREEGGNFSDLEEVDPLNAMLRAA